MTNRYLLTTLILLKSLCCNLHADVSSSEENSEMNDSYYATSQDNKDLLGYGSTIATSDALSKSMFGWGIGLAVVIAAVAAVVHSSSSGHSDKDDS
mgnify:CR=1 FL=1